MEHYLGNLYAYMYNDNPVLLFEFADEVKVYNVKVSGYDYYGFAAAGGSYYEHIYLHEGERTSAIWMKVISFHIPQTAAGGSSFANLGVDVNLHGLKLKKLYIECEYNDWARLSWIISYKRD